MAADKTLIDRAIWHLIALNPKEPFLGTLIQQLQITCSDSCPTAGVGFDEENEILNLVVNIEWFSSLTDASRKAILLHEMKHIIDGHLIRSKEFANQKIHNIATDMAVNCYIPNLPEGGCYPKNINMADYLTSDAYYDELMKQAEKQCPECGGGGEQDNDSNDGQPQKGKQCPKCGGGKPIPGQGKDSGSHDGWDKVDGQRIGQATEIALKRAMEKCKDYSKYEGNLKETFKLIDNVKKINWTSVLRKFCSRYIPAGDYVNTRSKTNRRYGLQEPGHKLGNGKRLAIGIDVSGSMTLDEINKILGQIKPLMQAGTEGVVLYFDTKVQLKDKLKRKCEYKSVGGGGTDFKDVFEIAKRMKFDGIVMFTDGYDGNSLSENQKIPTLWVISKEGKCSYDWGWQYQMTE
jgi:predicted metal-dependent peptidase